MKIDNLLFPRFPRIFTATIVPFVAKTALWSAFTALLIVNVYARANLTPSYWLALIAGLRSPTAPSVHQALAQAYWQQGLLSQAKRELSYAQDIINDMRETAGQEVLGASTDPRELLVQWEQEPERLRRQYRFWQTVAREKPDYRDAHLVTGSLAYQLGYYKDAEQYIQQARRIDPNLPVIEKLRVYLKGVDGL